MTRNNQNAIINKRVQKKTAKTNNKLVANRVPKQNDDLVCYKMALSNPFSVDANGARVPDMFCVPTATRRITRSFTLSSSSTGTSDAIILPSAAWHAFTTNGGNSSPTTFTVGSGSSYPVCYTDPAALASQISNYRIVGYGVKIIGTQNDNVASGKLYVATVPVSTWMNITDTVGGQGDSHPDAAQTMGAWLTDMGIPNAANKVNLGVLPSMTNSILTSVQRVNETPLSVLPKISSPEAFNFRQSKDSTVGYSAQDQTSTSWITSGDASYMRVGGHEAVVIGIEGAVANSNLMEIELVYHLEGTAAATSNTSPIAQANDRVVVNPLGWMQVVQQVAQLPAFRLAVEGAGNAIIPGLGTLANRLIN